jgi:hypothetical protein
MPHTRTRSNNIDVHNTLNRVPQSTSTSKCTKTGDSKVQVLCYTYIDIHVDTCIWIIHLVWMCLELLKPSMNSEQKENCA